MSLFPNAPMLPYPPNFITDMGTGIKHTLRTEELSGDVEGFTSHNNDLLTLEELLGHRARKAAKEVTLAIDDDL